MGQPTYELTKAHSGANCATTVLDGKYPGNADARLISPAFRVPPAGDNPRLRFWHWIHSEPGYDVGAVELREVHLTFDTDFEPDPAQYDATSGGAVNAAYLGGGCYGFASVSPDLKITYSAGTYPLRFYFIPDTPPALRYSFIGAMPEASRIFEVGQCATPQL